ncbi:PIG-L family deacetylase [Pelagicoccus sp. SDUM812003]|uniref:PIG-L family deacetylase n=1 Tax=Pelagicoccus sp. SDUM812003 TaxID=3041267 RepID=UPI0028105DB5|nr:PIG-L family deacetylase [Pelagicoccus sp. SDUM812003]MDQ8203028.1 PIG-L family deacetylase [Pelagicoccus sp. SDUM812003]
MLRSFLKTTSLGVALSAAAVACAEPPIDMPEAVPSSEIYWSLQKLNTLGRVLYVAAHPDDENTSLISYLSLGRKYDTAYLSLTRGDGGQNLIGPELRDELGVIRTQELLAARRIDGGQQFFSRAKDFGYSKTAEETLRIWDEDKVLADTVWVIRSFQPDVIVTRFNPEPGFTHGHHTASCLLAMEAFEAAADPTRFPEQLEWVQPWQATRVVWNASWWFFRNRDQDFIESQYTSVEVGDYEPLLGKSFNEIASLSRSQHRSQGFGTRVERGARTEYFQHLVGEPMKGDLFSGVSTDWGRVQGGADVERSIARILAGFDLADPAKSVDAMLELRQEMQALPDPWKTRKLAELDTIVLRCLGMDLKALADRQYVLGGERLQITLEAINRSGVEVNVLEASTNVSDSNYVLGLSLPENERIERTVQLDLPQQLPLPQPYWLEKEGDLGMFEVEDQLLIGKPENDPPFYFDIALGIAGQTVKTRVPLTHREVDPAYGERMVEVANMPLASVSFSNPVALFPNGATKELEIEVSAFTRPVSGTLRLELPSGWSAEPDSLDLQDLSPGESRSVRMSVTAPKTTRVSAIKAVLETSEGEVSDGLKRIRYEHIPEQRVFSDASVKAVSLDVQKLGQSVAYLPGAGDSVAESIREIGYDVQILQPSDVTLENLSEYDALVIGIRAYNTIDEIETLMPAIFEYAESGGTVIAQYNTSRGLKTSQFAPYPLSLSRDRVTDEFAQVRLLAEDHPVLNHPNRITQEDFSGWTQERGLYFPDQWDTAFTPILSINDPGESPKDGSLLVARHGEGYFVYTGLSWFRQLPAGVPGAYRILANMLSLGSENR